MPAPLVIAAIVGAVGSMAAAKMQSDAANQQASMKNAKGAGGGGQFGLGMTGTDKYMSTLQDLNEGNDKRQLGAGMVEGALGDAINRGGNDQLSLGLEAATPDTTSGFKEAAAGGFQPETGGGGFDGDQALQYAALASQLGSMLAPPPPPPAPRGGGGGSFNYQPITMRAAYGG